MIAYGNWISTIFFLLITLLNIEVKHICINAASRILSQSHGQGISQLSDMAIYAQDEILGLSLLLSTCMLANGALFFWISKKIKSKYGDQ
jgi:hypothetical protein